MPLACITGASSGIGKEFAYQLSEKGFDLILIARNLKALNELKEELDTEVEIICCDLGDETQTIELANQLKMRKIDMLINNAGFGDVGNFEKTNLSKDMNMINVNIKATHILMKKLLPKFIERDQGYILNVASSAGLMPGGPYMATYYATKAYVVSMTGAVYDELKRRDSDVHVCALCPGPVDTNFNNVAGVEFSLKGISAYECVEYALHQMAKRKVIIVPTFMIKAAMLGSRFLPRKVALRIAGNQQKKKIS